VYRQQLESIVRNGTPWNGRGPQPITEEDRAQQDYLPVTGTNPKTAVQVRNEDLNTLFFGIPTATSRVTRMRADLAHAALDVDLTMKATADQAILSNVRQLTREANEPQCPVFDGCDQVGTAPRSEALARSGGGGGFACSTTNGKATASLAVAGGILALAFANAIRKRRR
jgi:hypothetical protein